MKNVSKSTNSMVKLALLSAIALVLSYIQFPILPAFAFLKIDLGDIPALIGAFAFGPLFGIAVEGIKNLLIFVFNPSGTGGIGELANFIIGASFVGTAGFLYGRNKTKKSAIISLLVSIAVMGVVGVLANYFILIPLYQKFMAINIPNYLVYGIIPFNLIKGLIISVVTMLIYKRVSALIHAEDMNNKMLVDTKKSS